MTRNRGKFGSKLRITAPNARKAINSLIKDMIALNNRLNTSDGEYLAVQMVLIEVQWALERCDRLLGEIHRQQFRDGRAGVR